MSRELHDQLGQQLAAIRLHLEALRAQLGVPTQVAAADRLVALADELDRDVDYLVWDLRPPLLDHWDIGDALCDLVSGWSTRFGIAAECEAIGMDGFRMDAEAATHVYRMTQELLHNIQKHAKASQVSVLLKRQGPFASLIVEDDGRGFATDPQPDDQREGLGLVSLRERAALIGAQFVLESSPGMGTTVFVRDVRVEPIPD